ncbi:hypothetical protein AAJP47_00490 [Psychrobacter sp. B38]
MVDTLTLEPADRDTKVQLLKQVPKKDDTSKMIEGSKAAPDHNTL